MRRRRIPYIFSLILIIVAIVMVIYLWPVKDNSTPTRSSPTPTLTPTISATPTPTPTPAIPSLNQKVIYYSDQDKTIYSSNGSVKTAIYQSNNSQTILRKIGNIAQTKKIVALMSTTSSDEILDLFLIDAAKNNIAQKIKSDFISYDSLMPVISPDGQHIAYVQFSNAEVDYGYNLYLLNLASLKINKIITTPNPISLLSWSPDNSSIAYCVQDKSNKVYLKSVNIASNKITALYTSSNDIVTLDWAIANQIYMVIENPKISVAHYPIYKYNLTTKKLAQISNITSNGLSFKGTTDYLAYTTYAGTTKKNLYSQIKVLILNTDQVITIDRSSQIIGWLN